MGSFPIPLEDEEQMVFVEWLDLVGLRYTSIPNSTFTKSWKQKVHNKRMGLHAGFPDLVVIIPPTRAKDGLGRFLAIEMKRRQGGVVSADQKAWIAAINGLETPHVQSVVCKGAQEAIDYVNGYLVPTRVSPF
ncbi:VRR-NUC domain-containing protein [Rhodococcus sp. HS-D2]|uniref:VRR-NUC domain-containing protein n=1 Tax=Rhodococcus sp. HS-D2 TaxID=1384636 RepID=UPI000A5FE1F7|nr:VRR-NUC domain-containing protein [Rhodococcus sp. HS-D2]